MTAPRRTLLMLRTLAVTTTLLGTMLCSTLILRAQPGGQGGPPQREPSPGMQIDRVALAMVKAQVPLTIAVEKEIFSVYVDAQVAAQTAASSASDEFARRQQMQALQASVRKEVRALLSEAQQAVFDALATQQGPGAPPSGAAPPPQM